jgi:peptide/nickel transport system permease protein
VGLGFVLVFFAMALLAPLITVAGPFTQDYDHVLEGPTLSFLFGTDNLGRDMWSRIVYGAKVSLEVGFSAVLLGQGAGLLLGVVSGHYGGRVDALIQRSTEVMMAFPSLLLALALMAGLGVGMDKVIFAIAIGIWPRTTRVIRGVVLSLKETPYIEAALAIGASNNRIMLRHLLPNVLSPWLVLASAGLGGAILAEATLSFLGLGVPAPHPSWGQMLSGAAGRYVIVAPWLVIFPGLAIGLLVLGFNLFGDAIRDVIDPRLRGR